MMRISPSGFALQTRHAVLAAALVGLVGTPAFAQVDGTESVPRGVPFEARVMSDGTLLDTFDIGIRFTLYGSDGEAVWSEEWSDDDTRSCAADDCRARVLDGRLHVVLGSYRDLQAALLDADDYEVGYELLDGGVWVPISTRVPLPPVSHAMWATTLGSFTTTRLDVDGPVTVNGIVAVDEFRTIAADLDASTIRADVIDASVNVRTPGVSVGGWTFATGGDLQIDGEMFTSDGTQYVFTAADASDGLRLGDGMVSSVTFAGDVTVLDEIDTVTVTVGDGVSTPGAFIESGEPVFLNQWFSLGGDGFVSTGINSNNWMCWTGGFSLSDGNLCTGSVSSCRSGFNGSCSTDSDCGDSLIPQCVSGGCTYAPMFEVYMSPTSGNWNLYADAVGEDMDTISVNVICTRVRASNFTCAGTATTYINPNCPSYIAGGASIDSDYTTWWAGVGGTWPSIWSTKLGATP